MRIVLSPGVFRLPHSTLTSPASMVLTYHLSLHFCRPLARMTSKQHVTSSRPQRSKPSSSIPVPCSLCAWPVFSAGGSARGPRTLPTTHPPITIAITTTRTTTEKSACAKARTSLSTSGARSSATSVPFSISARESRNYS